MNNLSEHIQYLQTFIRNRLGHYFLKANENGSKENTGVNPEENFQERYSFVNLELPFGEYIVLLLALIPHIQPGLLDLLIQEFLPQGGDFTEFGGVKIGNHRGMVATGETAAFLLAGSDLQERLRIQMIFSENHFFNKEKILWLEEVKEGEPKLSGRILISNEWLELWMTGISQQPRFGPEFPAKRVQTKMAWEDAVLHPQTRLQINIIASWVAHNNELMKDENLSRKIKPGYRVLFFGPPGTGKTLTAALIGKQFNMDVYRIDLSQIVSKYIGETEKNLEKVFTKAENKNWVLFFDEADSLFGKRTGVQSSNDKYANQEVSYLLQRVEDFPGLLILASNFRNNIDAAFMRRFHQIIHFPPPNPVERFQIWCKSLPKTIALASNLDLEQIAQSYEITGAAILNVVQFASLQALTRKDYLLHKSDIIEGIRRELQKEEKAG